MTKTLKIKWQLGSSSKTLSLSKPIEASALTKQLLNEASPAFQGALGGKIISAYIESKDTTAEVFAD